MDGERNIETKRGGCLDELVKISSFRRLGVETTAQWGYEDIENGRFFNENPIIRAVRTRKPVRANFYIDKPKITRRIVYNK